MRNAVISLVVFVFIIAYSTFSFFYLNNFISDFSSSVQTIHSSNIENSKHIETANSLFKRKKNTLLLMISKEHINKISDSLISLDIAIDFENPQDIEQYKALLLDCIEDINMHNSSIN